ncbi:hypothetical protein ABZP36_036069 [Zizania latifolia]
MHGWPEVEKRFAWLAINGILFRSRFGQCIGMVGFEEFAGQIFDTLAWRKGITAQLLTKISSGISNLEALLLLPPSQVSTKLITHNSNISQLIRQKLVPTNDRNLIQRGIRKLSYFMEDNWKRVWVMALWLAINAGLFTWIKTLIMGDMLPLI